MNDRPILFLLHCLGGSARTWDAVVRHLDPHLDCIAIDLPGFGAAAARDNYSVADMADAVVERIKESAPRRWLLAGHSMGAKIAAAVARRAEDGETGLSGLTQIVLFAGSPPSPEPMDRTTREAMRAWFAGDAATSSREAQAFIDANVARPLEADRNRQALDDLLRTNVDAWRAWLDAGSHEDWSAAIGRLQTPTLIVAGSKDDALGPDAQARLMAPHFAAAQFMTIEGTKHLLPLERPDEVARFIREHAGLRAEVPATSAFHALLRSDRVSARTRAVLEARAAPDAPDGAPDALSSAQLRVLRAALDRVVPQPDAEPIDLAARVHKALAEGIGDGWRFDLLPSDIDAYRAALETLDEAAELEHRCGFAALDGDQRDLLLTRVDDGVLQVGTRLSAEQMRLWFEDLRADAVKAYVSHPATMMRIGYGGFANGGDGVRQQGFTRVGEGEREAWEPVSQADARR